MKLRIQRIQACQKNFNQAHIEWHTTGTKGIIPFFSRYGPGLVNIGRKTWYKDFSWLFREVTSRATLLLAIICSKIAFVSISFLLKYTQYGIICPISAKIGQKSQIWEILASWTPKWYRRLRKWDTYSRNRSKWSLNSEVLFSGKNFFEKLDVCDVHQAQEKIINVRKWPIFTLSTFVAGRKF